MMEFFLLVAMARLIQIKDYHDASVKTWECMSCGISFVLSGQAGILPRMWRIGRMTKELEEAHRLLWDIYEKLRNHAANEDWADHLRAKIQDFCPPEEE